MKGMIHYMKKVIPVCLVLIMLFSVGVSALTPSSGGKMFENFDGYSDADVNQSIVWAANGKPELSAAAKFEKATPFNGSSTAMLVGCTSSFSMTYGAKGYSGGRDMSGSAYLEVAVKNTGGVAYQIGFIVTDGTTDVAAQSDQEHWNFVSDNNVMLENASGTRSPLKCASGTFVAIPAGFEGFVRFPLDSDKWEIPSWFAASAEGQKANKKMDLNKILKVSPTLPENMAGSILIDDIKFGNDATITTLLKSYNSEEQKKKTDTGGSNSGTSGGSGTGGGTGTETGEEETEEMEIYGDENITVDPSAKDKIKIAEKVITLKSAMTVGEFNEAVTLNTEGAYAMFYDKDGYAVGDEEAELADKMTYVISSTGVPDITYKVKLDVADAKGEIKEIKTTVEKVHDYRLQIVVLSIIAGLIFLLMVAVTIYLFVSRRNPNDMRP